jgi:hypothetical protein
MIIDVMGVMKVILQFNEFIVIENIVGEGIEFTQ